MAPTDPVAKFFEVQLPQVVLASYFDFLEREGTLSFDVKDAGQWSFTFGAPEPVEKGLAAKPGLALTFTRKAFLSFIDGTLDVVGAVEAKEVRVKGRDFGLLEDFGRLLNPPSNDLGWDVHTVGSS